MLRHAALRYLLYLLIIAACVLVGWSIFSFLGIIVGFFLSFALLFLVRGRLK